MFIVLLLVVVLGTVGYFYYKYRSEQKAFEEFAKDYDLTLDQLSQYNGVKNKRIFVSVKGDIFDVTPSSFYTPGGSYHIFAGKDASTSLAKGDLEGKFLNTPNASLNEEEKGGLNEWHDKFISKYRKVGRLIV